MTFISQPAAMNFRDGPGSGDADPVSGENGGMDENDPTSFDPIFSFHHAFVDRMFVLSQKEHGSTKILEIFGKYSRINTVDSQKPTPAIV